MAIPTAFYIVIIHLNQTHQISAGLLSFYILDVMRGYVLTDHFELITK